MRLVLAEASLPIAAALRRFLVGVADVEHVVTADDALATLARRPAVILMASMSRDLDAEALAVRARAANPRMGLLLLYPSFELRADERAHRHEADAFLVGPFRRLTVLGALGSVLHLLALKSRVAELERKVLGLEEALAVAQASPEAPLAIERPASDPGESFIKKFLVTEVKRSRRYRYPSAVLLLALDDLERRLEAREDGKALRTKLLAEAVGALVEVVREADVATQLADGRLLAFLPHTPREGALAVAERAVARMRELKTLAGSTASAGVASCDPRLSPQAKVSFGSMLESAAACLERARASGGDRVEAAAVEARGVTNRISMG